MYLWGFSGSSVCLFCRGFQECKEHLFFSCCFSRRIWRVVMAGYSCVDPPVERDAVISWFKKEMRRKKVWNHVCKLCFGAIVYQLWKQRNDLLHGNTPLPEEAIVAQIRWKVRARLLSKGSMKYTAGNSGLVQSWDLQLRLAILTRLYNPTRTWHGISGFGFTLNGFISVWRVVSWVTRGWPARHGYVSMFFFFFFRDNCTTGPCDIP
jgi:hypothetical protein